jgi:hypothetical protein
VAVPGLLISICVHYLQDNFSARQHRYNTRKAFIKSSFRAQRSEDPDKSAQRIERPKGGPQGEHSE